MTLFAQLPAAVNHLAEACHQAGGRAFLVGGCVRDRLLHRPFHDWDVEVFGVPPRELERLLRRAGYVNAVGKAFGVFKWRPHGESAEIDVSIPRRDSKIGPGHRGIHVEGDPHMPVREAARRRDLTINAILYDLVAQQIVDPWGGVEDLRSGRLRAVDRHTFLEDPLRALRVVQFAARLEMPPTPELLSLCREASLGELPPERVQAEWRKLLLTADRPSIGMAVARDAQVLRRVFPQAPSGPEVGAVLDAVVPTRDSLEVPGRRWALMLTAWLAGSTPEDVATTLDQLWLHKSQGYAIRDKTLAGVAHLTDDIKTDAALRHLSTHAELLLVLTVRSAQPGHTQDTARALKRAAELSILTEPPPRLLLGRHLKRLGIPPGRHMGVLLKDVYEQQLEGAITTQEQASALAVSLWEGDQGKREAPPS